MRSKNINFWFILVPIAGLFFLSLYAALALRYGEVTGELYRQHVREFYVLYGLWAVVLFIHGLFEARLLRRYTSVVFNLVSAMAVNFFVSVLFFYFQPALVLTPRRFLLIHIAVSFVLVLLWLLLVKYFLKNRLIQGVYLFSFNQELAELENEITVHNYLGFKVLGHLNEQTLGQAPFQPGSIIILPDNIQAKPELLKRFYELRKLDVVFFNHRSFYEFLLRRVYLSDLTETWFLDNINYQSRRWYAVVKRVIDLLFGLLGMAAFAVSYPFVAALIKLTSSGPVLFTQPRVGKDGSVFNIYKYRTMSGGRTDTWTAVNDPRITGLGKFLRKSRVDELPQSINLLAGTMSLVGPRPEQPGIVDQLKEQVPFYDERHLVKPGLTGWAQMNVYAGSLEESKIKLQYDLYYIKHRSVVFDLEIILKTFYYIFTWQGR